MIFGDELLQTNQEVGVSLNLQLSICHFLDILLKVAVCEGFPGENAHPVITVGFKHMQFILVAPQQQSNMVFD